MNYTDLLMTHLTLQGSFYQVALYSSVLYLWKDPKHVRLYHWQKWIDQLALQQLPIYLEPFPTQLITTDSTALEPFFIKEISFENAVRDFVLFRHHLYFIDEAGLSIIQPESAHPKSERLAAGSFQTLCLSEKNRLALTSIEDGLFEYRFSSVHPLVCWDTRPTAAALWDDHDLLQLDTQGNTLQRLDFNEQGKKLTHRWEAAELKEHDTYYHAPLDLIEQTTEESWLPLFGYLPADPTITRRNYSEEQKITIQHMPHPNFRSGILNQDHLYVEKDAQNLYLLLGDQPCLQLRREEYHSYRIYPKSRNYRNQLHFVMDDRINFLIFHQLR